MVVDPMWVLFFIGFRGRGRGDCWILSFIHLSTIQLTLEASCSINTSTTTLSFLIIIQLAIQILLAVLVYIHLSVMLHYGSRCIIYL